MSENHYIKNCPACGCEFITSRAQKRFCRPLCRLNALKPARSNKLTRSSLPRNMLLVRHVDDVLKLADENLPERINRYPGFASAFPRALGHQSENCDLHRFGRELAYIANRMRSAWHPEAKSHIYAYSYTLMDSVEDDTPVRDILRRHSIGRPDGWMDSCNLVKIGTAYDPVKRRSSHLGELLRIIPELREQGSEYRLECCLTILPCRRSQAGEYLEQCILSSLPKEDHFNGEWYHDTNGIAKCLMAWFTLCHACYSRE